ncbi:MAG TPA: carboxypeptidase-like regulatory domain-containing protein [Candidatus Thermoplasmatota archaeon]
MLRSALVLFLLTSVAFAGCADKATPAVASTTTREVLVTVEAAPVEITLETGGIDGVVMDDEQQPVPGARIALVGLPDVTNSDTGGRFTFSNLQPMEYRITVKRDGYATAGRAVPVNAGEISQVKVVLKTIQFDVPYHVTHPWTGMVLAGYFVVNIGDGMPEPGGEATCSACVLPCASCFTHFNTSNGMRVLVFELEAQPSVPSPIQPNDYFWQLLGESRDFGRYNADYWIDRGQRHVEGGWHEGGDNFRFTNQCGLYWICANQRFTVHFTEFYFQGPPNNFTALPPE